MHGELPPLYIGAEARTRGRTRTCTDVRVFNAGKRAPMVTYLSQILSAEEEAIRLRVPKHGAALI